MKLAAKSGGSSVIRLNIASKTKDSRRCELANQVGENPKTTRKNQNSTVSANVDSRL